MSAPSTLVKSTSEGAAIVKGGARLSPAEEQALNLLLKKAGGEESGAPLYKISWAMEDNQATFDKETGGYKYDPKKIPVCIEPQQASYHLLVWVPPTATDMMHEHQFMGEDLSNGTYNCIMHFIDPKTDEPFNPTGSLLERIIPIIRDMSEIATATRKGFTTERNMLRRKKIEAWKAKEKEAEKKYSAHAEAILESTAPAFEGNPTSFGSGPKGKSFSDLKPGERQQGPRIVLTDSDSHSIPQPSAAPVVPTDFQFSFKSRSKAPADR